ncbi:MAG TPA: HlyD family secretion protein, partial [Steroidobacteraceae bacterium]|nr:HlyD family secretion protein [Steroidobacteraceae bacterium]
MSATARGSEPARDPPRGDAPAPLRPEGREPAARTRPLRERLRLPLMWGVPLLMAAGGLYFYLTGGRYQSTEDAYLRAAEVAISANVSGRVSEVDVRDNQRVRRGEILFRLDDRPFRIAVESARARLQGARLQVESLKADYGQYGANLRSAQSALAYSEREYRRQSRLLASGIASQSQVDRALLARSEAQQSVAAAKQQITAALAKLGGQPDIAVDAHPLVQQAQAALDRALLDLSYATVSAPSDGIVTGVEHLQAGSYLPSATPAFVLVSTHDVWVEADFKEDQLAHMRSGDPATVKIDAYPGRTFQAVVASITPGTGSQFSVLPPENATGNWVKVVQRLDVRLHLEGSLPAVRSGLSATVRVDTRSRAAEHSAGGVG